MKTSNITKSALALALGLCASGAWALTTTNAFENFEGYAENTTVGNLANNKGFNWSAGADAADYTYVNGSNKLVIDTGDNTVTGALANATAFNNNIANSASFEAKVSFTPATDTPDIGGADLKFALYAKAAPGSTNLVVYTGSENVTATAIAANTETTVKVDFTAANEFNVYIGGNLVAGGPFTFANNGTISKVEFAGNGEVDDLAFTYNATEYTLTWVAGLDSISYTRNGGEPVSLDKNSTSTIIYGEPNETFTLTGTTPYGVKLTGVVSGNNVTISGVSNTDLGWYFPCTATAGQDGTAANPFEIDSVNALVALKDAVANVEAARSKSYIQTANIDMASAGAFAGIGAVGAENATTLTMTAFEGTYDGNNKTISNIVFTKRKGSALFNLVRGATIKDLTVDTVSYESDLTATKLGGAMIVGNGVGCTLQHLITTGNNGLNNPSTYNAAGIANRLELRGGDILVVGCTNSAAIYSVYTKVAGICSIVECDGATGSIAFVDCANTGNIVANGTAAQIGYAQNSDTSKKPGMDGTAGILGYSQHTGTISFTNCVSTGTIEGASGATIGSIIGKTSTAGITIVGGSAKADYLSVNSGATNVSGAKFATVADGVATFVADDALAAGNTYKVMAAGATASYAFAAPGTIAFDQSLATPTYAITAPGLVLSDSTSGTVTTYTARNYAVVNVTVTGGANATAVWTVNGATLAEAPATLTEGDTFSVTYTANEGYKFADGAATSASGTAGTEAISINIDDAVADSPTYNKDDELAIGGEGGTTHELTQTEAEYLNAMAAGKTPTEMTSILASVNEETFEKAALLNQDITKANAGSYQFNITKIRKSGTTVYVTVSLTRSGTVLGNIRGTAALYTCDTPNGTYTKQASVDISEAELSSLGTTTKGFTGVTDKFFKAVIE